MSDEKPQPIGRIEAYCMTPSRIVSPELEKALETSGLKNPAKMLWGFNSEVRILQVYEGWYSDVDTAMAMMQGWVVEAWNHGMIAARAHPPLSFDGKTIAGDVPTEYTRDFHEILDTYLKTEGPPELRGSCPSSDD